MFLRVHFCLASLKKSDSLVWLSKVSFKYFPSLDNRVDDSQAFLIVGKGLLQPTSVVVMSAPNFDVETKLPRANIINKFQSRVTTSFSNKPVWLDVASHMTTENCYSTLIFVYAINSKMHGIGHRCVFKTCYLFMK